MMGRKPFHFKNFSINQENSALGVNTDSCIFGAFIDLDQPKNVLDVGCGNGLLINFLNQKWPYAKYIGIDNHKGSILDAKLNVKNYNNVIINECDLFEYITDTQFDHIISNPPFFFDDLKSNNEQKNQSKHWSKKEFLKYLNKLKEWITPSGCLWILLPNNQNTNPDLFINEGWNIIQEIIFKPRENKAAHLRIYKLSRQERTNVSTKIELTVYEKENSFSKPVFTKLAEFYLDQALYLKNKI